MVIYDNERKITATVIYDNERKITADINISYYHQISNEKFLQV